MTNYYERFEKRMNDNIAKGKRELVVNKLESLKRETNENKETIAEKQRLIEIKSKAIEECIAYYKENPTIKFLKRDIERLEAEITDMKEMIERREKSIEIVEKALR